MWLWSHLCICQNIFQDNLLLSKKTTILMLWEWELLCYSHCEAGRRKKRCDHGRVSDTVDDSEFKAALNEICSVTAETWIPICLFLSGKCFIFLSVNREDRDYHLFKMLIRCILSNSTFYFLTSTLQNHHLYVLFCISENGQISCLRGSLKTTNNRGGISPQIAAWKSKEPVTMLLIIGQLDHL